MSITHQRSRSLAFGVVIVGTLATLCGCGQSGPDRVLVHGTITFAGGAPPADGTLVFTPAQPAEGYPARPGRAKFTQGDGTFAVRSVQPGDGLVPGTYHVVIDCWQRPPTESTPGISHVPAGYAPPDLEIKIDSGPIQYDVDIPTSR